MHMSDEAMKPTGPLAGVKVVDLTGHLAGPTCTLLLADLGADVVKVEQPGKGDDSRNFLPPAIEGESASFMTINRNKRGIAVDLKAPAGKEIVRKLVRGADILVENSRPRTMINLGLGYEDMRKENPGLIYCAVSGFGRTGPWGDRGGVDLIAQGVSGLMSLTGEGPGRPPVKVGVPITDVSGGILATVGVLAAYAHRLKTGQGQMVDTSLLEAGVFTLFHQAGMFFATGESAGPMGSAHPLAAPYQAFRTKDGAANIGATSQLNWGRLCTVLGKPQLAQDPRFAKPADRMVNLTVLVEEVEALTMRFTRDELLGKLEAAGVPCGPILKVGEVLTHPQVLAREMVVDVPHAKAGSQRAIGVPVKLSATPGNVRRGAPILGEHTREVLAELGYANAEVQALIDAGVVEVPERPMAPVARKGH